MNCYCGAPFIRFVEFDGRREYECASSHKVSLSKANADGCEKVEEWPPIIKLLHNKKRSRYAYANLDSILEKE